MVWGMATDPAKTARKVNDATRAHEDAIIDAYKTGDSMATIAASTIIDGNGAGQFTEEGVRKLLIRRGVKLRPRGRPAKPATVEAETADAITLTPTEFLEYVERTHGPGRGDPQ